MNAKLFLTVAKTKRPAPVFVCRKCLKRVGGGRGIKRAVKSELKTLSVARDEKQPRMVMTGCFGLCPKQAVVMASDATLNDGDYLLVSNAAAAGEAAERLTARNRRVPVAKVTKTRDGKAGGT